VDGLRHDSLTARRLAAALGEARFRLIDVGCSGGLDPGWRAFEDRLSAFGFDPSVFEIDRLAAQETNPEVRYVNGYVGLPDDHPLKGAGGEAWRTDPWRRVSASRTQQLQLAREAGRPAQPRRPAPAYAPLPASPAARAAAGGQPLRAAPPRLAGDATQQDLMARNLWVHAHLDGGTIHLPDFLAAAGVEDVDFVKIDVDGTDFEVLRSLEQTLSGAGVLGVSIEVGYSGTGDPHFNSFHNVDAFMRRQGFDLMDLTVRRYALASLPFPFLYPHPIAAQTSRGRPLIGDALYLRDFGHACRLDPAAWSDAKLIKLAALYCLCGLLDHAAELLDMFKDRLGAVLDIPALLDQLAAEIQTIDPDLNVAFEPFADYAGYTAAYEADVAYFYGAADRRHDQHMAVIVERNAALLAAEAARADALAAQASAAQVWAWHEAMTRTLSWRITAPLRALRRLLARP